MLEFAEAMELIICNTWFKKSDSKLITYRSGDHTTVTDYILERRGCRMVHDVKVVPGEACAPQHQLLVSKLEIRTTLTPKRSRYVPRIKIWKLRYQEIQEKFQHLVSSRAETKRQDDVNNAWNDLKSCLLESAKAVCGCTKGPPKHRETWWWDEKEAGSAIDLKRQCFKRWKKTKLKSDKALYKAAKKKCKLAVDKVKEAERVEICNRLEEADGEGDLYRIVKQMKKENADVIRGGGIKNASGQIVTEEEKVKAVWEDYFKTLLNEEFCWSKEDLETCSSNDTVCEPITEDEIREAMDKMKKKKAAGPTGITFELIKAAGIEGIKWLTEVCNAVIRDGGIPEDWKKSWMTAVYKGKGDAMDCGSYRGIKLLEHAMKIMERVLESRLRSQVEIDNMQFGFTPGKSTTDAIFILRQLQEKYLSKKKELWMAFVDLEKAFDRVPRDVVWWALRYMGIGEGLIQVIRSMYHGVKTAVKFSGGETRFFDVGVGVHQGSVLSPLLFIIVLEALSRRFRDGLPLELLYADDLALVADSKEELITKFTAWKAGLESKGLRVNVSKTKVMQCAADFERSAQSGKYPCGVCKKGVGSNSILCCGCRKWIHHRCSGIRGKLKDTGDFTCPKCTGNTTSTSVSRLTELTLEDGTSLEIVDKFCYLGDMIGACGGAEDASRARVRCGWKKFHELTPVLTLKGASFKLKGKIYSTCVRSAMVYGSETWPMKKEDLGRLEKAEHMMMRRMCGVTLRDRVPSSELYGRLDIDSMSTVVTRNRLRWFGHVQRKPESDWTRRCTSFEVSGQRGRGRGRKTWRECVDEDLRRLSLDPLMAMDRESWRQLVRLGV